MFLYLFQENSGLVVPWIIGFITFMALEAVAMVYSNVLRDHVNRVRTLCNVCNVVVLSRTPAALHPCPLTSPKVTNTV
jgi:hypothetical protein